MELAGKTIWITGASSGVGEGMAKVFHRAGANVILSALNRDELENAAAKMTEGAGTIHLVPFDITDRTAREAAASEVLERFDQLDVLVNNAGYAILDDFGDASWTDHATMLEVMLIGYTRLCHALIPQMKQRGYGRIINVSSLSAFIPPNAGSLYGGIKSYVVDLSVALDLELRPHGIHCTAVCPGFTYTEFHDVMRVRNFLSSLPRFVWMSADDVAREGYEAVMAGKLVIINGWINRLIALIYNLMPKPMRYGLQRNAKKWTAD